ncbi:hypothetical protein LEMLEM_LOCUS2388, partial [Lemmus lemmus]
MCHGDTSACVWIRRHTQMMYKGSKDSMLSDVIHVTLEVSLILKKKKKQTHALH